MDKKIEKPTKKSVYFSNNSPKTESAKWKHDIDAMIFQTKTRIYWRNICREEKENGIRDSLAYRFRDEALRVVLTA